MTHRHEVLLPAPDDWDAWRGMARRLIAAQVPPDRVVWRVAGAPGMGDLFTSPEQPLPTPPSDAPPPRVPRAFPDLARKAALHGDPARFGLLYRLLWRLQAMPRLLDDATDDDVRAVDALAREVRRDIHKMRAFLRFREVAGDDGQCRYVAWFEPVHHIVRANAAFFVDRFAAMHWSILTPRVSLHWDGQALHEGPPAQREDAPAMDAAENLWRSYYASIFNPARLKVSAMLKEMPRRYWKNMPEAALIPELIAGAQAREAAMVEAGAIEFGERPRSLGEVAAGIVECRRCPIGCNGTTAVMGEGAGDAALMIVGEQPGDTEEQQGRPFAGPAGRLLRAHLQSSSIDVAKCYVTNAVKHFKFEPRGKRRLHQSPTAREIDVCRWWIDSERMLVRPRLVLALGASAARGVLGRTVSVQKERGRPHGLDDGAELWVTSHPSYLLRLQDDARAAEEARFIQDLQRVAARLREAGAKKSGS